MTDYSTHYRTGEEIQPGDKFRFHAGGRKHGLSILQWEWWGFGIRISEILSVLALSWIPAFLIFSPRTVRHSEPENLNQERWLPLIFT